MRTSRGFSGGFTRAASLREAFASGFNRVVAGALLVLLLVAWAGPGRASHYALDRVGFVTVAERRALGRAGVLDTSVLLDWTATAERRAWLAQTTSISATRLAALAARCDLLRVEGIGPTILDVLVKVGIGDSHDLARARAGALLEALKIAARGTSMQQRLPAEETLTAWILEARLLRPVVE